MVVSGRPLVDGVVSPRQRGHAGLGVTVYLIGSPPSDGVCQRTIARSPIRQAVTLVGAPGVWKRKKEMTRRTDSGV